MESGPSTSYAQAMGHFRRLWNLLFAAATIWMAVSPALASETECFDAEVSASISRQTPTVMPDCDDCIIMTWPWIVELQIQQVHSGRLERGPATVLTVQHTYYRRDFGARRWWLRRNTLGAYNALQPDEGETPQRCSADSPAARPYIQPSNGRTLEDLRREGEEHYGPEPSN